MTQLLYTVPDAAKAMGISQRTLEGLIAQHRIASVLIPSSRGRGKRNMRRIEAAVIDAFITAHRQEATT